KFIQQRRNRQNQAGNYSAQYPFRHSAQQLYYGHLQIYTGSIAPVQLNALQVMLKHRIIIMNGIEKYGVRRWIELLLKAAKSCRVLLKLKEPKMQYCRFWQLRS